jgi:DNA-binding CsgD family transcriptional regulator
MNRSILNSLTPRQVEILDLLARGFTNSAIADSLVLTEKAVENHVTNVYERLGIDMRHPAVNARVTAALMYLRESNVPARDLWANRFRPRRGAGASDFEYALSDDDLDVAVGGVDDWESRLIQLIERADFSNDS